MMTAVSQKLIQQGSMYFSERYFLKSLWLAFLEEDYKYRPNASYLTTNFLNSYILNNKDHILKSDL